MFIPDEKTLILFRDYCTLNEGFDGPAISNAMMYACQCHANTLQSYDDKPYTYHLKMTYDYGCKFAHLLTATECELALSACWCHDVIEDTRQSYNDVAKVCGVELSEIVYALTNEKGRTREERANDQYYLCIRQNEVATFVKLCDRLANVTYSCENNQRIRSAYRNEYAHFKQSIWNPRFAEMFSAIEQILGLN